MSLKTLYPRSLEMLLLAFSVSEFVILKIIRKNNARNQVITGVCYLHTVTRMLPVVQLHMHVGSAVLDLE